VSDRPAPRSTTIEGLARWRVPGGFVAGAVVLWLAQPTPRSLAAGAMLAAAGEALRIWAAGHLIKSQEVTASGPYRWFGHPLYVGSSVMGAGLAVASASIAVALVIAIYLATTITAAIRTEEAFLQRRFGAEYDAYRTRTAEDRFRRFSAARALANREYRTVAGLALVVLLLVLKATYNGFFWGAAAGR
jgi:hypothetical protein